MVTVKFECPYCGEQFAERDDIEFIQESRTCPSCEAAFDDDDLEGIEDVLDLEDEDEAASSEEEDLDDADIDDGDDEGTGDEDVFDEDANADEEE